MRKIQRAIKNNEHGINELFSADYYENAEFESSIPVRDALLSCDHNFPF